MIKSYEQYVRELKEVYKSFYSQNGSCPYFEKCSENMQNPKIKFDLSARVGVNYGSGKYPKVLMLGQEGTSCHNEFVPPYCSLDGASSQHYPKTLYTLAMLLKNEEPESFARKDLIAYEDLFTHYALTNYFKCAFADDAGRVNGLKHNSSMKNNCYKLLLRELDVLTPELMVVQGKFTTKAFWDSLDQCYCKGVRIWGNKTSLTDTVSLYQHKMNGKSFYVLYGYHPASIPHWNATLNDLKAAIKHFSSVYDLYNK